MFRQQPPLCVVTPLRLTSDRVHIPEAIVTPQHGQRLVQQLLVELEAALLSSNCLQVVFAIQLEFTVQVLNLAFERSYLLSTQPQGVCLSLELLFKVRVVALKQFPFVVLLDAGQRNLQRSVE